MADEKSTALTVKSLFSRDDTQKKFKELLGEKAQGFMTSMLQISSNNALLAKADPISIYNAAIMAAALDLPINQNLGYAYIIPYNSKQLDGSYKQVAQFQMGYKGFIQLAQRSGQFKTMSNAVVYEGQLIRENPLEGFEFNWDRKTSDKIIGFAAFFRLLNGFESTFYMSVEQVHAHGKKYSKTYDNKFGLWQTDFEAMGKKTVLKLLLSRYAPLSIQMQKAVLADQGVLNNDDGDDISYVDNGETPKDNSVQEKAIPPEEVKPEPQKKTNVIKTTPPRAAATETIEEATIVTEPEPTSEPITEKNAAEAIEKLEGKSEPPEIKGSGIAAKNPFNEKTPEPEPEPDLKVASVELTLDEVVEEILDQEAVKDEQVLDYYRHLKLIEQEYPPVVAAVSKRMLMVLEVKRFVTKEALKTWYLSLPKLVQDNVELINEVTVIRDGFPKA